MFANNTSILNKSPNNVQLQSDLNSVVGQLNDWFQDNLITLNLEKTYFIQFINKSICNSDKQIKIDNNHITTVNEIKFLGLIIDNKLSWKGHINHIILKLSSACYCIRAVKPYVAQNTLKIICYSHFHSIMTYALLFWDPLLKVTRFLNCKRKRLEL